MKDKIKNLKKIELHLHLDGSVSLETICKLKNKSLEEVRNELVAPSKCNNLSEYLQRFNLPIECMQTKENLKLVALELVNYLESQNVVYAEIRFAPQFHIRNNLSYEDVVESVLEGLHENKKVKTNLILCMMRGMSKGDNLKTINTAYKYLKKGVCALDLAGAEDKYPLSEYVDLFKIIKQKNIPFTIHAGENGSYKEVELAVKMGARRIGHGIHSFESKELQKELMEKKVLLEICPTSNVQTNSVSEYKDHPIYDFYKKNINVCINTDNKTVSNITLNKEYEKLYNTFNFSIEDFKRMNMYALEGAFLSDEEKDELIKELSSRI